MRHFDPPAREPLLLEKNPWMPKTREHVVTAHRPQSVILQHIGDGIQAPARQKLRNLDGPVKNTDMEPMRHPNLR